MKNDIKSPILRNIISYPKFNEIEYHERLKELIALGVEEIILTGPTKIFNLNILGKGHSGVVVRVNTKNRKNLALKIRRIDSNRKNSYNEAKFMIMANSSNIGPRLIDSRKNFILMELIEGQKIIKWLENQSTLKRSERKERTKSVLKDVMEQCYLLDRMLLDHGELTKIDNHVVISADKIFILDFESSSVNRKTANVTAITQSLVFSGLIAKKVRDIMDFKSTHYEILDNLKKYKQDQNRQNFNKIISSIWG